VTGSDAAGTATPSTPHQGAETGAWLDALLARRRLARGLAVFSGAICALVVVLSIRDRPTLDLDVYLLGAHHLFDGQLYVVRGVPFPHLPFTYPPFAALIFTPGSVLPFGVAQWAWSAISIAALLAIIALSLWAVRPRFTPGQLWLLATVLLGPVTCLEPLRQNFHFGQINLVLDLAILADVLLVLRVRSRVVPRGILVGIAAAVKLIPLVFVLYFVVTRQFRAAATAVATFVACTLIGAACNPHESWLFWTKYAYDAKRVGGVFYVSNQSIRGALERLSSEVLGAGLLTIVSALALVAGIALARWAAVRSSALLAFLVTAATGMLVSPITWTHHFVWVIPMLAWLWLADDRPRFGAAWAALGVLVLWAGPMWLVPSYGDTELHESALALLESNAYFYLLVVFLGGIAVMLAARTRRARRETLELAPLQAPV
jgi:alpha-1,2-mannosyltransferase